jgi:hypothetical protein
MSGPTGHGSDGHGVAAHGADPAHDDVDYGKVVGVGVVSLIIFALSIWWASIIMRGQVERVEAKTGKAREFDRTREEIGIVDQVPFVADKRLPKWKAERKQVLSSYGWVDRGKGTVHIPIDEAMAKVAAGALPAGAPK